MKKEKGNVILSEKPQKTWTEILTDFSGAHDFSVYREQLKDKPRPVKYFSKIKKLKVEDWYS